MSIQSSVYTYRCWPLTSLANITLNWWIFFIIVLSNTMTLPLIIQVYVKWRIDYKYPIWPNGNFSLISSCKVYTPLPPLWIDPIYSLHLVRCDGWSKQSTAQENTHRLISFLVLLCSNCSMGNSWLFVTSITGVNWKHVYLNEGIGIEERHTCQ